MQAQSRVRGATCGFVSYECVELAMTWEFPEVRRVSFPELQHAAQATTWTVCKRPSGIIDELPFSAVEDHWRQEFGMQDRQRTFLVADPSLVLYFIEEQWQFLHAVACPFGGRAPSHRHSLKSYPRAQIWRRIARVLSTKQHGQVASVTRRRKRNEFSAEEIIELLEASATCKSLRHMPRASRIWGNIYQRRYGHHVDLAMAPCYDTLRRARIRLDLVAMLAFRFGIRTLLLSGIEFALFVFIDASPQWRGRELYGGTLDIVVYREEGPSYSRHLLPVLNLGTLYRTTYGKTVGLLWMLVLMIGPDYSTLRSVLMRIRALATDLGVAFRIRDSPDFLVPYLRSLGARLPHFAQPERWLLPNAVSAPGWHHIFDGLLRFGLSNLQWFGEHLALIKALVKWLRNHSDDIVSCLIGVEKRGAAAIVSCLKLPNFAQWRWKTLGHVVASLRKCVVPLRLSAQAFAPWLSRSKDKKWSDQVRTALTSPNFIKHFEFTDWFTSWVTELERWGSLCPCEEHRGMANVQCPRRGRLLPYAFTHARAVFDDVVEEMRAWRHERFYSDLVLMQQVEACVAATISRALGKMTSWTRCLIYCRGCACPMVRMWRAGVLTSSRKCQSTSTTEARCLCLATGLRCDKISFVLRKASQCLAACTSQSCG